MWDGSGTPGSQPELEADTHPLGHPGSPALYSSDGRGDVSSFIPDGSHWRRPSFLLIRLTKIVNFVSLIIFIDFIIEENTGGSFVAHLSDDR